MRDNRHRLLRRHQQLFSQVLVTCIPGALCATSFAVPKNINFPVLHPSFAGERLSEAVSEGKPSKRPPEQKARGGHRTRSGNFGSCLHLRIREWPLLPLALCRPAAEDNGWTRARSSPAFSTAARITTTHIAQAANSVQERGQLNGGWAIWPGAASWRFWRGGWRS